MPPFVPLADGAQVQIKMRQAGLIVENRLWFVSRQPPIDQAQLDALASGVATWHTTQVLPNLASELEHVSVHADDWTADPPPFSSVVFTTLNGSNGSGCHSANVAVRVLFKGDSSQSFPSNSNFIPGIPKDAVNLNTYTDSFKDAIFEAYASLVDLAPVFGPFPAWTWVITSRQLNNSWRTTQDSARMDFVRFPSPYVSPRRRRLHHFH